MSRLILSFLGGFRVELDGQPLTRFKSNKVRALLAYLAVESARPHHRDRLAAMLWPDRTGRDALSNLRYTLASLRRTLGEAGAITPFLLVDHDTVQFNTAEVRLDVADLERQVVSVLRRPAAVTTAQSTRRTSPDVERRELHAAVDLYRGHFLDGFSAGDAAPFEEWVVVRREHIAQQVMAALGWLAADAEQRGAFGEAQSYARQQVGFEPWNEDAQRALMRALALDGQRIAALHQFQAYCRILHDELGVAPSDETVALSEAIRAGDLDASERRVVPGGGADGAEPTSSARTVSLVSPVVARERELGQLEEHLLQALAGAGRVIFVSGEAGSGKSVLLGEFVRRALQAHPEVLVAGGACDVVAGIGDPYLPFREILRSLTGDTENRRTPDILTATAIRRIWAAMPDTIEAILGQGEGLLDVFIPAAEFMLRLESYDAQFGVDEKWRARIRQIHRQPGAAREGARPVVRQSDLFDQVARVLTALARRHPMVLVLDDLQWSDPGTVGLLFHLGRYLAASRILVIAAYRPDAMGPRSGGERHPLELVVNELQRVSGYPVIDLDACDGREFITALLDGKQDCPSSSFAEALFRHTEGQPLFTVELLRSLEDRGELVRDSDGCWRPSETLHWDNLPVRVEAAIAERIGQLTEQCYTLLAAASVEGQEFAAETIARSLGIDERAVLQCLSRELGQHFRLVSAVDLHRFGPRRLSRFRFRHHLFRKYLYDHLDTVQRVHLHEAIGSALEALQNGVSDESDALAPRLAWHFEEAMLPERSAAWHLRAGKRASCLAASAEAIAHLTRGLALVEDLPETSSRLWLQLELQLALLAPLTFAKGFWAPERIEALQTAYAISLHPALAGNSRLWMVSAAMAYYALWSAEPARAIDICAQLLQEDEHGSETQHRSWAHCLMGCALLMQAKVEAAGEHLDEALNDTAYGYDPQHDPLVGIDVRIMALTWKSLVLWQRGYPDQARHCLQEALTAAEKSVYSITLVHIQSMAGMLHFLYERNAAAAWQQIQVLRASAQSVPPFGAFADGLAGPDVSPDLQGEQLLQQMRNGLAQFQTTGSGLGRAGLLLLLARGYAHFGHTDLGLATLDEALAWMRATGVRTAEAEAHRLRGELLLLDSDAGGDSAIQAEACFREAIEIAQRQGARWWELRATVSLCRLLAERSEAQKPERSAASRRLATLYASFTEGFDTPDLQDARSVLQSLETR